MLFRSEREVVRNIDLKLARGLRSILSFLSRTSYRKEVKSALKGDAANKTRTLENICFSEITDLNKNNQDTTEFRKQAAFQMGQCVCLMDGIEVYTKEEISEYHPLLVDYLQRNESSGDDLESFKKIFLGKFRKLDLSKIKEGL